jgi:hypothetical protein
MRGIDVMMLARKTRLRLDYRLKAVGYREE